MSLPNGYSIIERQEEVEDPKTKEKTIHKLGYILKRKINGVEQYCGTDMAWQRTVHAVKRVQFFKTHRRRATKEEREAGSGETITVDGIAYVKKMASWQYDQDRKVQTINNELKPVKIATSELPICEINNDVNYGQMLSVQLDVHQTRKLQGILRASRQNNRTLEGGKPIQSMADCVWTWLDSITFE